MEATAGLPALTQPCQNWLRDPLERGRAQSCGRREKPPGICASLSRGRHSLPVWPRDKTPS